MKLAVVCANGRQGQLIVKEALAKGLDVTAVVRGANRSAAKKVIQKDLFDLTAEDLAGFDAVADAFGMWDESQFSQHDTSLTHLCDILSHTGTRLLVVGGAGSLYTDTSRTRQVVEDMKSTPYYALAAAERDAFEKMKQRTDVDWTYICPAADFQAEGPRKGEYTLAGDVLTVNGQGKSEVSYADYAIAFADEVVSGAHAGQQISVVSK